MREFFTLTDKEKEYLAAGEDISQKTLSKYATLNKEARYSCLTREDFLRPSFSRDVDKIINCPLYNRYGDKTQVLSFYRNDNITRRASHVQYVSKIARTIGRALRLNMDLIEAIALGHDIGHTPFGHKGEQILSACYQEGCEKRGRERRYFNHNVQSARYFRKLTSDNYGLSLQTLSGILSHNGEKVCKEYAPSELTDFDSFDAILEKCFTEDDFHKTLRPNTLEGCVVRLSDMIAYVGKDRQDLYYAGMSQKKHDMKENMLGTKNWEIVSNMVTNIVKNSIESPSLNIDEEVYQEFKKIIDENYQYIYSDPTVVESYSKVQLLMQELYTVLCDDLIKENKESIIYKHHMKGFLKIQYEVMGISEHIDDIVSDYIASMTDDYFIDLCKHLHICGDLAQTIEYHGYFGK